MNGNDRYIEDIVRDIHFDAPDDNHRYALKSRLLRIFPDSNDRYIEDIVRDIHFDAPDDNHRYALKSELLRIFPKYRLQPMVHTETVFGNIVNKSAIRKICRIAAVITLIISVAAIVHIQTSRKRNDLIHDDKKISHPPAHKEYVVMHEEKQKKNDDTVEPPPSLESLKKKEPTLEAKLPMEENILRVVNIPPSVLKMKSGKGDIPVHNNIVTTLVKTHKNPKQEEASGGYPRRMYQHRQSLEGKRNVALVPHLTNSFGETDKDSVVDNTPPEIAFSVNPENPKVLRPPDHRMAKVSFNFKVFDNCTEPNDLTLVVTAKSSEPDDDKGDGAFTGDIDGEDGFTGPVDVSYAFSPELGGFFGAINLRVECDGRGVDRIYTITATVKDASGNETTVSHDVIVLRDPYERKK